MKMNRRQFGALAALSAAGLVVPRLAQAQATEKQNMRPAQPPAG
jgi:hypothetical protein